MIKLQQILTQLDQIQSKLKSFSNWSPEFLQRIKHDLDTIDERISAKSRDSVQSEIIRIWSDGACAGNPGPGGWGTVILRNGTYEEFSGYEEQTTNNIMELTGALEGIRQTPAGASIVLSSDSQYLVNGMTQWIRNWKRQGWKKSDGKPVANKKIWMKLETEASIRNINWQWIKGHAGHPENERCDQLAKSFNQT